MKISELKIRALHGIYDYDVEFNDDITFFYGENGCGKTTILNILENIISGEIYKLFRYRFKSIELRYYSMNDEFEKIIITSEEFINSDLRIVVEGESEVIPHNWKVQYGLDSNSRKNSIRDIFFKEFIVSQSIREKFNFILLPLNRIVITDQSNSNFVMRRKRYLEHNEESSINTSMYNVEELVFDYVSTVNAKINALNNKFRNLIFTASLDINVDSEELNSTLPWAPHKIVSELEKYSKNYMRVLKKLNINQEEEQQKKIIEYFDFLIDSAKKFQKDPNYSPEPLHRHYSNLNRIGKITSIFEIINSQSQEIKINVKRFLEEVNFFLKQGVDEKEIIINSFGRIYFISKISKGKLRLDYLSSGEKQIVTLFANLLFKKDINNLSIFIVDEPELSLHLRWQKKFVEAIHNLNLQTQLIFATHSPEIIGHYRDKVKKLEKKYNSQYSEARVVESNYSENDYWN